jgi:hypothetical protein
MGILDSIKDKFKREDNPNDAAVKSKRDEYYAKEKEKAIDREGRRQARDDARQEIEKSRPKRPRGIMNTLFYKPSSKSSSKTTKATKRYKRPRSGNSSMGLLGGSIYANTNRMKWY